MLLPGPEAMQLATYCAGACTDFAAGWRRAAVRAAGCGRDHGAHIHLCDLRFGAGGGRAFGIKAAVLVIVIEARSRSRGRALKAAHQWLIAGVAFLALFLFDLPFPVIVIASGLLGYALGSGEPDMRSGTVRATPKATAFTVLFWLALWWMPLIALSWSPLPAILADIGRFFSMLAVVTFGGAYAVLAYMAQDVVEFHGWLSALEMLDGLGLAETTPGPLILVTTFVGILAGYKAGGVALGLAGGLVSLWATFVPCFLWIFAGGPWIDRIAGRPRLVGALSAITAAVVGVILDLSLWFSMRVLFSRVVPVDPGFITFESVDPASIDPAALALFCLCLVTTFVFRWNLAATLATAAVGGLLLRSVIF
ncbi:MAG: chromate transporter [Geminicoccaceae bacterium]